MNRSLTLATAALVAVAPPALARHGIHHSHHRVTEPAATRQEAIANPPAPAPIPAPTMPALQPVVAASPPPPPKPAAPSEADRQAGADKQFLEQEMARANYARDLTELAAADSYNGQLRAYARSVLLQRQGYANALAELAHELNVGDSVLTDPSEQQRIAQLERLRGDAFDQAYILSVRDADGAMLQAEQTAQVTTQNPKLRQLLQAMTPVAQRLTVESASLSPYGSVSGRHT